MPSPLSGTASSGRSQGQRYERAAEAFLCAQGLTPITRNFCFRGGEIDLVMRDGDAIVFVEVRFRNSASFGSAEESVDARKQKRLRLGGQIYLRKNPPSHDFSCRFDVVAFTGPHSVSAPVWIQDAFSA